MKRSKHHQHGKSGIDFDSCLHTITSDSRMEYCNLKMTRQYIIKTAIKDVVKMLFHKYKIEDDSDCKDVLRYLENQLCGPRAQEVLTANNDALISRVLDPLTLPQRNELIRLLTHSGDELNAEVLAVYPTLRARSETLLATNRKRKTRSDKIDLQFISDFMHEHCRYDPMLICMLLYCEIYYRIGCVLYLCNVSVCNNAG